MKQPTKRFFSVIVGTVFIFGALVIYQNFIKDVYKEAQTLKATILQNEQVILKQEENIKIIRDIEAKAAERGLQKNVLGLVVPFNEDESEALHQIYGIASENNLSMQSIQFVINDNELPIPEEIVDSNDLIRPPGVIEIAMTLNGTYQNFKEMLRGLETNIRIFSIREIGISDGAIPPSEEEGALDSEGDRTTRKTDIELILDKLKKAAEKSGDVIGAPIATQGLGASIRYQYSLKVATYFQK